MKRYYKSGLVILALILSYILGSFIPIHYFRLEVDDTKISKPELIKIFISIVAALLTLCAVTVALFKEKILGKFSRPILTFDKPQHKPIWEHISELKTLKPNEIIEASKYSSRISIKNIGNVPATDVTLSLEKIEYLPLNSELPIPFEPPGNALKWGNQQEKINILPNSEKLINIVEVFAPRKTATPDGLIEIENAELIIGEFADCGKKSVGGVWNARFVLHAQNHKHLSFDLRVEWRGKWKGRLTDFEAEYGYIIKK